MRANLQINRSLAKNIGMSSADKAVSEEALLREWAEIQAAQQDPAAFKPLYERYYEPIFRFIFRRTADEHLTADLSSQVFLQAMQKLSAYTYRGVPFSAWLFRMAINEVAMYYRRHQKRRVVSLEDQQLTDLLADLDDDPQPLPLEPMVQALDQLKESDLELIELRYFEKRPYREIADLLEITENNAKVKVHRILERIKRRLRS